MRNYDVAQYEDFDTFKYGDFSLKADLFKKDPAKNFSIFTDDNKNINLTEMCKKVKDSRGRDLWISVGDRRGSEYDIEDHKLRFRKNELSQRTFLFNFFEEFAHAGIWEKVNGELNQVGQSEKITSDQKVISELPVLVQKIVEENASKIPQYAFKRSYLPPDSAMEEGKPFRSKTTARLAFDLPQELTAKRNALRHLMKITGGEIKKLGISKEQLTEYVLLSMLGHCESEEFLPFWGVEAAKLPPHSNFEDLMNKTYERFQELQSDNPNPENSFLGTGSSEVFDFVMSPLNEPEQPKGWRLLARKLLSRPKRQTS
jgi:hypothetical protein